MSCWWRRPLCLCRLPLSHLGPLRKTFGHKLAVFNYKKMPGPCHWGTRCCWVQYRGGRSRLMEGVLWVMQRHWLFMQHPSRLRSRNGWNLWAKKGSLGVWATLDGKCWNDGTQKGNLLVLNSENHRTVCLTDPVEFLIEKVAKLPWKCRSLYTSRSNTWETGYGSNVFLKPQGLKTHTVSYISQRKTNGP